MHNPVMFTDPTGLFAIIPDFLIPRPRQFERPPWMDNVLELLNRHSQWQQSNHEARLESYREHATGMAIRFRLDPNSPEGIEFIEQQVRIRDASMNVVIGSLGGIKVVGKRVGLQATSQTARAAQPVLRAKTAGNFRHNLQQLTGQTGAGMQAHHVLPQARKFDGFFNNAGLNVHDPIFGSWVGQSHQSWSHLYNSRWSSFMASNPGATAGEILDFASQLAREFGFRIWF